MGVIISAAFDPYAENYINAIENCNDLFSMRMELEPRQPLRMVRLEPLEEGKPRG